MHNASSNHNKCRMLSLHSQVMYIISSSERLLLFCDLSVKTIFDRVLPLVMRSFQSFLYFLPKQLMILNSCCISRPLFSGGFLLGGGGPGGGGRGTPRRRESSSARVGGSRGPTARTYCSTPMRPRSERTCSARTKAQVRGWGGGEGGPGGQSGRFWFIYPFIPIVYALLPFLVPGHSQPRRRIR